MESVLEAGVELEAPTLGNLETVLSALKQITASHKVAQQMADVDFLDNLKRVFEEAEDLEDSNSLILLAKIMRRICN